MAHAVEYLDNPDFAEFDPRTVVPRGWEFRVHQTSGPLRDRWLSHYRIGAEERAGLAVLAPCEPALPAAASGEPGTGAAPASSTETDRSQGEPSPGGLLPEAVGQWLTLPPHEPRPVLGLGLGLVAPDGPQPQYGDFRVQVESEAGHVDELFRGRLDNLLWRDLTFSLARYSGQTVRLIVENLSSSVLLVDYARVSGPGETPCHWQMGPLTVEVVRSDPFLIECDVLLNEIGPGGDGPNRLLLLEGEHWAAPLRAGAPYPFGDLLATRDPLHAKTSQALHLVTLTEHSSMRRSILHRAVDDCLRAVRREQIGSLVATPLLLGTQDLREVELFARDLAAQVLEWYRTFHPRHFTRFTVATLFEPLEVHDIYHHAFAEAFESISKEAGPLDSEELLRLAGMANLVKSALHGPELDAQTYGHIESLLDALSTAGPQKRSTLGRVLEEAGLAEKQMLDLLCASYRSGGRLDDRAMKAYERLHELDPANAENTRAMASAYRCRFMLDGDRTRHVYEQVFRADAGDDENNRFLAAHYILAGTREAGSLRSLVFERVGLGPGGSPRSHVPGAPELPSRPMPPAAPFVHGAQPQRAAGGPRSEVLEATVAFHEREPVPAIEPPEPVEPAPPPREEAIQEPAQSSYELDAGPVAPDSAEVASPQSEPEPLAAEPEPFAAVQSEPVEPQPPPTSAEPMAGWSTPLAPEQEPAQLARTTPGPEPEMDETDLLLQRLAAEVQEQRRMGRAEEVQPQKTTSGGKKKRR